MRGTRHHRQRHRAGQERPAERTPVPHLPDRRNPRFRPLHRAFSSDFIGVAELLFFCRSCECGDTVLTALAFPAVSDRGFDFFKRPEICWRSRSRSSSACLSLFILSVSLLIFSRTVPARPSASAASCGGTSGAGTQTGASRYQRRHRAPN